MPETYHYIPQEFRNTPRTLTRGEPSMNPHSPYEKITSENDTFCPNLYDCPGPGPCGSLLLHRVPSASLYPEQMLAQWPTRSSSQSQYVRSSSREATDRSSIATLADYGEWILGKFHDRPPSLLPPAPQLIRLPSSDTGKVECRLSSPPASPKEQKFYTDSDRNANREQLKNLSGQLEEVSFSTEDTSAPPTRPITPVLSLTTSNYSRTSFGVADHSPCTTISSPQDSFGSSPTEFPVRNIAISTRKPVNGLISGPRIRYTSSPLPRPPLCQNRRFGWGSLPADPARDSTYFPFRPVPNPDMDTTAIHLRQPSPDSQEVSYIEWDDDENGSKGNCALSRIKRSFADLRAAERYISEANTRRKVQLAKEAQDAATSTIAPKMPDAVNEIGQASMSSTSIPSEHENSFTQPSTRLRKKASTKFIPSSARQASGSAQVGILSALPLNTTIPSTPPPSTGKRKRTNTMSSQRSQETQKKAKNGVVGKLVRRLLGAKKSIEGVRMFGPNPGDLLDQIAGLSGHIYTALMDI